MNIQNQNNPPTSTPLDNLVIFSMIKEEIFTVTVFVYPLRSIECAITTTLYSLSLIHI